MPNNKQTREPVKVIRQYNDMCRNCLGTGKRDGEKCSICEGHGVVHIVKEIFIYIEPINP